jgi:hypothetical protein
MWTLLRPFAAMHPFTNLGHPGTARGAIRHMHAPFGSSLVHPDVLGWNASKGKENRVREFIPFDDRWYDSEPPGPLVPLPMNASCVWDEGGVFHWVPECRPEAPRTSPLRAPIRAAVPALSSST